MKYKINEIFYSIQAEGHYAGYPALFIRFSGCNLRCPWCDTKYHEKGEFYTKEELEEKALKLIPANKEVIVVFTGGEPTLQLRQDEELFKGFFRTVETNGILLDKIPTWINCVTCSPKTNIEFCNNDKVHEIKVVYESKRQEYYLDLLKHHDYIELYMQPLEENGKMNIKETLDFILQHPEYKFSLQYHKLIGVR